MRVGIIIDHLQAGGITTSHYEQTIIKAFEMIDTQHEIIVFTFSKLSSVNTANTKFKIVSIGDYESHWSRIYKKLPIFFKKIVHRSLGLLYSRNSFHNILYKLRSEAYNNALLAHKIRIVWSLFGTGMRSVDVPYIATCLDCNDLVHPYLPEFGDTLQGWGDFDLGRNLFFRRATYIVTGTQALKEQVSRFYGVQDEKIVINPLFIPDFEKVDTHFQADTIENELPRQFLFCPARYMPQKNHILLLLAVEILKKEHGINMPLYLVGLDKGNLQFLKDSAVSMGVSDLVTFSGPISHSDLSMMYKTAFALVFPAFNGPDNLPPIEAMHYGCPVIASKLEGTEEQLRDAALTFDPHNEYELVDQILNLLNTAGLRETLISRGYDCINDKYPTDYARRILDIVDNFEKRARAWDGGFYNLLPNFEDK